MKRIGPSSLGSVEPFLLRTFLCSFSAVANVITSRELSLTAQGDEHNISLRYMNYCPRLPPSPLYMTRNYESDYPAVTDHHD
jgi:hypothetical protein